MVDWLSGLSLEILFYFEVCRFDFLFRAWRMEIGTGFGRLVRFAIRAGVYFEYFVEGIRAIGLWLF